MTAPSLFSETTPHLRLVWDSSTLEHLMRDPLYYFWHDVLGYRGQRTLPLVWGICWHDSLGIYYEHRLAAAARSQALAAAIAFAVGRAKELDLEELAADTSDTKRNLMTLLRALVWYDDEFGDQDLYEAVRLADGSTGIEQQWASCIPTTDGSPLRTANGEEYIYVTNMDQVVRSTETGRHFVVERKSTISTPSASYWLRYDPSVQINSYDAFAAQFLTTTPLQGVLVECCQTAVGFTRFARHEVYRTPEQRTHWFEVICWWVRLAEQLARDNTWRMAMNLGTQVWESAFRDVERRTPVVWEGLLRTLCVQEPPWNPLERH